ncbi:MAG TPA: hypothetical protein VLB51_08665 [Methylomirabilota bacterium]|nr:hypothetical protein [Methylomirabilota bacterium]
MAETETTTTRIEPDIAIPDDSPKALDRARDALESARQSLEKAGEAMAQATSTAKTKGREVADRTTGYLNDAKRQLARAKEAMAEVAARSRGQLEKLYKELTERYRELQQRARELGGRARERIARLELGERRDQVVAFLQERPGTSVLIALAAGFVVGYATRPRR